MQLGYITGSLFVDVTSGWRYMYGTSTPICVIMAIGMWWLPPSPRWLLLCAIQGKKRIPEAKDFAVSCLCRIRGKSADTSVIDQVDLILDELAYDEQKTASFTEMFQGKCLKALIIGCGLVFFQQVNKMFSLFNFGYCQVGVILHLIVENFLFVCFFNAGDGTTKCVILCRDYSPGT